MFGLSFDVVDYESQRFGRIVKGYLTDKFEAAWYLEEVRPAFSVFIYDTIVLSHDEFWPPPDPDGTQGPPEWYTYITVRAFPDVDPGHAKSVAVIGKNNRVVRIPVARQVRYS